MAETHRPMGLKLTPAEREAIAAAMKRHSGPEQRREKRVELDESFQLIVRFGTGQALGVTPRDVSASGLGFYHVAYVHPGTEVGLVMKAKGADAVSRKGTVVRCRHVKGRVHEVGVLFEERIEIGVVVGGAVEAAAPAPAPLDEQAMYAKIAEISEGVRKLATERADMDAILERIGAMATLLMERSAKKPQG